MNDWIDRRYLQNVIKDNNLQFVGDKCRVDHVGCPDGVDTRGRLYVEVKDNGIVAYCFNCQCRGYVSIRSLSTGSMSKKARVSSEFSGDTNGESGGSIEDGELRSHNLGTVTTGQQAGVHRQAGKSVPYAECNLSAWPRTQRLWLVKSGVAPQELKDNEIGYNDTLNSVIFPVKNPYVPNEYSGYIQRNFNDYGAKYYFRTFEPDNMSEWVSTHKGKGKYLVLCEDVLSAIRVNRTLPSLALLKATMTSKVKNYIIDSVDKGKYERVYIFLDMDNPTVVRSAYNIHNSLSIYNIDTYVVEDFVGYDPKHLDSNTLDTYLENL